MSRDELANIENRILEKKIADKKKEELRQKNIAVSDAAIMPRNILHSPILDVRRLQESTETLPAGF